jgi:hypothetical protein
LSSETRPWEPNNDSINEVQLKCQYLIKERPVYGDITSTCSVEDMLGARFMIILGFKHTNPIELTLNYKYAVKDDLFGLHKIPVYFSHAA